jgi:hypothetical protein
VDTEQNDIVDKFNVSNVEPRKSLSQPKNSGVELKISFHEASGLGVTKMTTDNEASKSKCDKTGSSEKKLPRSQSEYK